MAVSTLKTALTIALCVSIVSTEYLCPAPWKQFRSNCYLFFSMPLTFKDAERYCRGTSLVECRTSTLVSISDRDEFVFVRDLVYSTIFKPVAFYMGAYTSSDCQAGTWSDGSGMVVEIGDEPSEVASGGGCTPCSFNETMDTTTACDIERCMVANLQTWLTSDNEDDFMMYVADYRCNDVQLPFVCEANDIYDGL